MYCSCFVLPTPPKRPLEKMDQSEVPKRIQKEKDPVKFPNSKKQNTPQNKNMFTTQPITTAFQTQPPAPSHRGDVSMVTHDTVEPMVHAQPVQEVPDAEGKIDESKNPETNMQALLAHGVTTFSVLRNPAQWRTALETNLQEDPVFVNPTNDMVMGSFRALATPHSYHCEKVRELRAEIFNRTMPLWTQHNGFVEMLPDRVMVRPSDKRPSGESWHRDESPSDKEGFITGGWINIGQFPDIFICKRGSHSMNGGSGGFAKIPQSECAALEADHDEIVVQPGHAIVFFENIKHKVNRGQKVDRWRQFVGWRFSMEGEVFDPQLFERLRTFRTLRIKSGQEPPMYSTMHRIEKVQAWSLNVHDQFTKQYTVKSGKKKGETFRVVHRFLQYSGDYEPYTKKELEMFYPHRYCHSCGHWTSRGNGLDYSIRWGALCPQDPDEIECDLCYEEPCEEADSDSDSDSDEPVRKKMRFSEREVIDLTK